MASHGQSPPREVQAALPTVPVAWVRLLHSTAAVFITSPDRHTRSVSEGATTRRVCEPLGLSSTGPR